MSRVRVT